MSFTEPTHPAIRTLTQAQRIVDAVVDSLPEVAVFVLDQDLRYLVAGGAAMRTAGFAAEDFLGKTVAEVAGPGLAAPDEPRLRLALGGQPFTVEHEARDCRFLSHGVSLTVDGRRCVLVLSSDLSERHAIESGRAIVAAHGTVLARLAASLAAVETEEEAHRATYRALTAELGRDRMARLRTLTAALSEALRPEQVLLLTVREIVGVLEADGWCVTLVEPGGMPVVVSCEHLPEAAGRLVERDVGPPATRAETTWLTTRAELEAASPGLAIAEPSLQSALVIRLGEPDGAWGVLVLSFAAEQDPGDADRDLVTTAARLAADALVRAGAYAVEHRAAVVLQESLLAGLVPRLPGAEIRARYRPADPQYRLRGDWYDATVLDGHTIGLSVGDVVGSGLEAATAMGRLRAAAVTLAIDGSAPGDLLRRLERVCQAIPGSELATIAYAALDTRRGAVRFACAGHPPPLVVAPEGGTTYLWDGRSMPLGVVDGGQPRPEGTAVLPPGSRFVLYSDGLVEQPRRSITAGLERLAEAASAGVLFSLDRFCDSLETALPDSPRRDDVAILCVELDRPADDVLEVHRPARARELAGLRASMRAWLGGHAVTDRGQRRLLLACGEACANVVEHAYGATEPGELSVWLARDAGVGLTARVQDSGRWREPSAEGLRGRGTRIMRGSVDRVEVSSTSEGTEVCLRLAL